MVLVSPSSLIFVAVVAIWAVYLVVHVARRREHLATARTVDRFSTQMRVLQRRSVRLDPPSPSAVRVSSAGMARTRPLVAQATPDQIFLSDAPDVSDVSAEASGAHVHASMLGHDGTPTAAPQDDFFVDEPGRRTRGLRLPARRPGSRAARTLRAAALLLSLLALGAVGTAVALSALPWWVLAVPVLALLGVFSWLRAAARALTAQRRRAAAHARRERERADREARQRAADARPTAPVLPVAQEFVAAQPVEVSQVAEESVVAAADRELIATARAARPDPLEVAAMAHTSIDEARAPAPIDPLLADDGWQPTPVPPPTYTLKAKAQRPLPPPMEVPVPIEVDEDDVAWDETRHQPRVVSA